MSGPVKLPPMHLWRVRREGGRHPAWMLIFAYEKHEALDLAKQFFPRERLRAQRVPSHEVRVVAVGSRGDDV